MSTENNAPLSSYCVARRCIWVDGTGPPRKRFPRTGHQDLRVRRADRSRTHLSSSFLGVSSRGNK